MATSSEIDFMKALNSESLGRLLNNILKEFEIKKVRKIIANEE